MSEPHHDGVLKFVQQKNEPFAATEDVAEAFDGVSDRTIRKRLNDLVERGDLRCREIGSGKVFYE
jgi:DeoR/GlpR family transcriptional regulator of sugar metabolism